MTALSGTTRPVPRLVFNSTSPNISGFSSPDGLSTSIRTLIVRVFSSTTGETNVTAPRLCWPGSDATVMSATAPTRTAEMSESYTSAITQTRERSAISKSVSVGMIRMPWTTFFTTTTPLTSAWRSSARRTVPERSTSAMSAALMSHRRNRDLAASSKSTPPWTTAGSWLSASWRWAFRASRYSCCVAIKSGL